MQKKKGKKKKKRAVRGIEPGNNFEEKEKEKRRKKPASPGIEPTISRPFCCTSTPLHHYTNPSAAHPHHYTTKQRAQVTIGALVLPIIAFVLHGGAYQIERASYARASA